jgi:hypothetical protein
MKDRSIYGALFVAAVLCAFAWGGAYGAKRIWTIVEPVLSAQQPQADPRDQTIQNLAQQLAEANETVAALRARAASQTNQIANLQTVQQAILEAVEAAGKVLAPTPDGKLALQDKPAPPEGDGAEK